MPEPHKDIGFDDPQTLVLHTLRLNISKEKLILNVEVPAVLRTFSRQHH